MTLRRALSVALSCWVVLFMTGGTAEAKPLDALWGGQAAFARPFNGAGPFATNGDSHPVIGQWASAFFDSATKATWVSWAGTPDAVARKIYVAAYYHKLGKWCPGAGSSPASGCPNSGAAVEAGGYVVATNPNSDSHGEPGMVLDNFGRANVFFGAHGSALKYSYSTNAHDPSAWTATTDVSTFNFTGANPVLLGGKLYVFTQGGSGVNDVALVSGTVNSGGGVSSWTPATITNFAPGFGELSNVIVQGSSLCFGFTFYDNVALTYNDAYYGCYDTTNGSFADITGAHVIASGSLPLNRTTAQANFLVFQSPDTSHASIIPGVAKDNSSVVHLIYANGVISNNTTSAGTYTLYETYSSGGAWSAGAQVAGSAVLGYFFDGPALLNTSSGVTAVWGQQDGTSEDATVATLASGSWSAAQTIQVGASFPISFYTPVNNAISQAEFLISEAPAITQTNASFFGTSAIWLYGSAGFVGVPYVAPSAEAALAGYWTFDSAQCSGSTTSDSSGNGNNGAITGTTCAGGTVTGQIAQALQFTGGVGANYGSNASIKPAFPLTVTTWVDLASYNASFSNIFSNDGLATVCAGVSFAITNTGRIAGEYGNAGGFAGANFYTASTSTGFVPTGKWQFIALTFQSQKFVGYDQTLSSTLGGASGSAAALGYSSTVANTGPIAATNCNGATGGPNGPVDDLRVYSALLAPWQISQIFWQGVGGHQ